MNFFSSPPLKTSVGKECSTLDQRINDAAMAVDVSDSKENRAKFLLLCDELDACDRKPTADKLRNFLAANPVGTLSDKSGSAGGGGSSSNVPLILAGSVFAGTIAYIMLKDHSK